MSNGSELLVYYRFSPNSDISVKKDVVRQNDRFVQMYFISKFTLVTGQLDWHDIGVNKMDEKSLWHGQ